MGQRVVSGDGFEERKYEIAKELKEFTLILFKIHGIFHILDCITYFTIRVSFRPGPHFDFREFLSRRSHRAGLIKKFFYLHVRVTFKTIALLPSFRQQTRRLCKMNSFSGEVYVSARTTEYRDTGYEMVACMYVGKSSPPLAAAILVCSRKTKVQIARHIVTYILAIRLGSTDALSQFKPKSRTASVSLFYDYNVKPTLNDL